MQTDAPTTPQPTGAVKDLFTLSVQLARPFEPLGEVPEGLRVNCYIADGLFEGALLRGKLRPVGGEWFTLRRDGVGVIDVRCTLETDDGAVIFGEHSGFVDFGESGFSDLQGGKLPRRRTAGVTATYRTAHPKYAWINRVQCAGWAAVDLERSTVEYHLFYLVPQNAD